MKKNVQVLSICMALTSATGILHAEDNINAGKQKSTSCNSCHGENGNSQVSNFPKLAQQHSSYLQKQLHAFKEGTRNDPMMSSLALSLTDEDITDLSAYYSTQKISDNTLPIPKPVDEDENPASTNTKSGKADTVQALIAQGSDLYRNGDLKREVSACIACHGPLGEGNKPASFPALKSQHADYLIKALTDFKTDSRNKNPQNIMHMIAKKMTDQEIKAVSYHISMMK